MRCGIIGEHVPEGLVQSDYMISNLFESLILVYVQHAQTSYYIAYMPTTCQRPYRSRYMQNMIILLNIFESF